MIEAKDNKASIPKVEGAQEISNKRVKWEVSELLENGKIVSTIFFSRGSRVYRFVHTYDPKLDKEQYDAIVREHGPMSPRKLYYKELRT